MESRGNGYIGYSMSANAADREEENGFFQGWFGFLGPWENIGQDEDFPTLAEVRKERERVRNSMLFT